MKIVADEHIPFIKDYFAKKHELILLSGRQIKAEDVKEADLLLVRSITSVNASLLAHSTVKFVGSITAGADHLDTDWLQKNGIKWCVAAGFNAQPVADYVVSVIAALQSQQLLNKNKLRAAVIGVGQVGRLVVTHLQHLGFDVVLCDPLRALNEADFLHVALEAIEDVDFISLHVPLSRSGPFPTHHFIDKHFLERQKPGCVLVNASRGAVIDTEILLKHAQHLICCLDVWEHEPTIHQGLLEQVLIGTPHMAGYSVQSKMRGIDIIYRALLAENFISAEFSAPTDFPIYQMEAAMPLNTWQAVVLKLFDPLEITARLRLAKTGAGFDALRHAVNNRFEFRFTRLEHVQMPLAEKMILQKLGCIA